MIDIPSRIGSGGTEIALNLGDAFMDFQRPMRAESLIRHTLQEKFQPGESKWGMGDLMPEEVAKRSEKAADLIFANAMSISGKHAAGDIEQVIKILKEDGFWQKEMRKNILDPTMMADQLRIRLETNGQR